MNKSEPQPPTEQVAPKPSAGVMVMHGHLRKPAKGFWEDAWSQVLRRPGAVIGLTWIGIVAFFAVFGPLIASGHPLIMWELGPNGERGDWSSPLLRNLTSVDVFLLIGGVVGPVWVMLSSKNETPERVYKAVVFASAAGIGLTAMYPGLPAPVGQGGLWMWLSAMLLCTAALTALNLAVLKPIKKRGERMGTLIMLIVQAGLIIFLAERIAGYVQAGTVSDFVRQVERSPWFIAGASAAVAFVCSLVFVIMPIGKTFAQRVVLVSSVGLLSGAIACHWWSPPPETFDPYYRGLRQGTIEAVHVLIPFSPNQRQMELDLLPPGATAKDSHKYVPVESLDGREIKYHRYVLGTDSSGQDLLSQLIHACRLSISIGFVATGIATIIGVTMGSLMGYFGGWVDLILYRIVEIFMAIPLLFLLIVAAALLPRNIYVMMLVIGCATWMNSARFIRAEFYRLRDQDFVQAARALGLPLRHVLFRHMLPNGVTPVLVEVSFAVAVVILFESILSFLGLGPADQASWGRLLSEAFNDVGDFIWWLAIFPGLAIFLTVLSLTLVGEAMRDAIDPKLKKAAH